MIGAHIFTCYFCLPLFLNTHFLEYINLLLIGKLIESISKYHNILFINEKCYVNREQKVSISNFNCHKTDKIKNIMQKQKTIFSIEIALTQEYLKV